MPNEKEACVGSGVIACKGREQKGRGEGGNGRGGIGRGSERGGKDRGNEKRGRVRTRGGSARGQGAKNQTELDSRCALEPVAGPSSRTYEEEIQAMRKAIVNKKKLLANLDPCVKKELEARQRVKQLSRSLLPDAPPRKRQKKPSPERVKCRLTVGTPSTPPARKLQPWQICNQQGYVRNDELLDTDDGVRPNYCPSPISTISITEIPAVSDLLVDFTSGLLKTDVGNWPCMPLSNTASQPKPDSVPTSAAKIDKPQIYAKKINLGSYTEKTVSDLEQWFNFAESDDEDVADLEINEQTGIFHHQITTAKEDVENETDLRTWLTNDDKDSTQLLTELIPTEYLTFDWAQDNTTFQGKRESFTGIAGPTFPVTDDMTPLDMFLKFFDDELIDLIVRQTNKYATREIDQHLTAHSRLNFFKNVDRCEIAGFLAILILQGLLPNPIEKNYWGENSYLTLKNFPDIMAYNRFILLKRLLHFSDATDSQTLPSDEKKLRKIKPVLDLLQKKFSSLYLPRQEITVDESLLKWQGRLSFAQRIASKVARVGIKSYELCESDTGYLWRFFIYTGRTDKQTDKQTDKTDGVTDKRTEHLTDGPTDTLPQLTNVTSKIVHDLVKPLYKRGYTVVMDNFYNSPLLARFLKSQGTDCFGTLRVNREFVPEAIKAVQKHELREGELFHSYTKDLSVVMWRDSNVVSLLSTYHDGVVGGVEKYGRFRYKPQVVLDYNHTMGGVDRKDQLLSAFPMERVRNIVWYKKVFRRLINITLQNAHIIFQTLHKQCSPREFRMQVAEGLIKMSQLPAIERPITVEIVKMALARKPKKLRPILKGNHFIGSGPCKNSRCEWCKKSRTSYICKQCGVALCLEICFEEYHTVPL